MVDVAPVDVRDPEVLALVVALDAELAAAGYGEQESFGYDAERLAAGTVHLLGARGDGVLVGIGGVELDGEADAAELKRFYVLPGSRGSGAADALLTALLAHAAAAGVGTVRLETGVHQHAALAFYRRHGFCEVPRFGPYVRSATSVCLAQQVDGAAPSRSSGR